MFDEYRRKAFWNEVRYKSWVVLEDGTLGVLDHIKPDGTYGVRPVNAIRACYRPNLSAHWSEEDRARIPHELALSATQFRSARRDELPHEIR